MTEKIKFFNLSGGKTNFSVHLHIDVNKLHMNIFQLIKFVSVTSTLEGLHIREKK